MNLDKISAYLAQGYAERYRAVVDMEAESIRRWRKERRSHFLRWTLPFSVGLVAFATMPLWLHWLVFGSTF